MLLIFFTSSILTKTYLLLTTVSQCQTLQTHHDQIQNSHYVCIMTSDENLAVQVAIPTVCFYTTYVFYRRCSHMGLPVRSYTSAIGHISCTFGELLVLWNTARHIGRQTQNIRVASLWDSRDRLLYVLGHGNWRPFFPQLGFACPYSSQYVWMAFVSVDKLWGALWKDQNVILDVKCNLKLMLNWC